MEKIKSNLDVSGQITRQNRKAFYFRIYYNFLVISGKITFSKIHVYNYSWSIQCYAVTNDKKIYVSWTVQCRCNSSNRGICTNSFISILSLLKTSPLTIGSLRLCLLVDCVRGLPMRRQCGAVSSPPIWHNAHAFGKGLYLFTVIHLWITIQMIHKDTFHSPQSHRRSLICVSSVYVCSFMYP